MAEVKSLADALTSALKDAGAVLVGFADMAPVSFNPFPVLGRGVSIAIPFVPELARQPGTPTANPAYVDAYFEMQHRLNPIVAVGRKVIRAYGFNASGYGFRPFFDGSDDDMDVDRYLTSRYPHKTTATLANLGWIGRMGVLVTRKFGPHVWLATILTDAPLPAAEPCVTSFCGKCRRCQDACPVGAIQGALWNRSLTRSDLVDIRACQKHRRERGKAVRAPMCGLCLAACPVGLGKEKRSLSGMGG
ncbi:4Fe-4S dicluster domain-containing protein [Desulfosarcina sp. OttesenSCG-928-A07]|nr:4Fe-4S dicluster domain-containing protein [Desulfosarcina sp. OttesenSCG-928-G17]MDL2329882.1 4Fe-4S dicluster domain-containing protein [Desulfosarcina sp. OttesenSCG-928-A07]